MLELPPVLCDTRWKSRSLFLSCGIGSMQYSSKCTSKGIWRQGTMLKHRNSLQTSLCPVVICPCLCSSDVFRSKCIKHELGRLWRCTLNPRALERRLRNSCSRPSPSRQDVRIRRQTDDLRWGWRHTVEVVLLKSRAGWNRTPIFISKMRTCTLGAYSPLEPFDNIFE